MLYPLFQVAVADAGCKYCFVDKTEMFLELHSNSLVRLQCMEYVQRTATELIKYVTAFNVHWFSSI